MNNMTPKDMIIFSLGPVQSFIATARRTQDLWMGSQLLSKLTKVALHAGEQAKGEPIFPSRTKKGDWPRSIPNRTVLFAEFGDGANVGRAMAKAANDEWLRISGLVALQFANYAPDNGWRQIWNEQIPEWLETYWVSWQWDGNPNNYGRTYRKASLALEARKRLRPFPKRAEPDEKCTLCGIRQALRSQLGTTEFWQKLSDKAPRTSIRFGERLCAVCSVKRFARESKIISGERFPSTSSIAAAAFRLALFEQWDAVSSHVVELMQAWDELGLPKFESPEPIDLLAQKAKEKKAENLLKYDGDFLYPEFYTETNVTEALGKIKKGDKLSAEEKSKMESAARKLAKLREVCRSQQIDISLPSPYYTVLAMDGDKMGKTISQEKNTPDAHRELSQRLADFAEHEAPRIIEQKYPGALVYSGGDDTLALLPVKHALEASEELRKSFSKSLTGSWGELTLSAGLAVAHHQNPLQGAIRAAQIAERHAKDKDRYNRNALVVITLRRSGEQHETGSKWDVEQLHFVPEMSRIQKLMEENKLSSKFAQEAFEEAPVLAKLSSAHEAELWRLLTRHSDKNKWLNSGAEIKIIAEHLAILTKDVRTVDGDSGLEQLAKWLLFIKFVAQGGIV